MNHPFRSQRPPAAAGQRDEAVAEDGRLSELFAEAAYDVTPSAVPLAAIERAGRRRRRRRHTAVVGAVCAALLVPPAMVALRTGGAGQAGAPGDWVRPSGSPAAPGRPAPSNSPAAGTSTPSAPARKVRIVAPGERVTPAPGGKMWLTKDGVHWRDPLDPGIVQFRGVSDGNLDLSTPGVAVQESSVRGDCFMSGIFHGPGVPARVVVRTIAGELDGSVLTLAGKPGWGVWYATLRLPGSVRPTRPMGGVTERVTVYDTAGGVLATQDFGF